VGTGEENKLSIRVWANADAGFRTYQSRAKILGESIVRNDEVVGLISPRPKVD
jgi:hypothetical protein